VYRWTLIPLFAGVILLIVVGRPAVGSGRFRLVDWSLIACLIAIAAQLIPLQASLRDALSPHGITVDRLVKFDLDTSTRAAHPLTLDPESTMWALALGAAYIGVFWSARTILSKGGVRTTVRGIAALGAALTALVAVQRATSPSLLYWTWQPMSAGASPYGPFVNRNALASWLAMAVPLMIGYAMARQQSRSVGAEQSIPGASIDPLQLWLAAAAILMTGGLLASMSRAGILGGVAGLLTFIALSRRRVKSGAAVAWMFAGLVALIVLASAYANFGSLALRMKETTEQGPWGRPAIWRDTWRMVTDFWATGVGAGAFQRAMLAYQQGSREFFFNQAHNEYLQLLAEGGLLIAVPACIALVASAVLMAKTLDADGTSIFWIRAGAICSVVAIAVQSIWDTGLRTPANGVLFAAIVAVALHQPRSASTKPAFSTTGDRRAPEPVGDRLHPVSGPASRASATRR
jgi:O-antigen ligase